MTTYIPSLTLPTILFSNPAAAILLPVLAGSLIGFSIRPKEPKSVSNALRQPPLRPPPWVFGPVWTTLYTLMGYAAYRAWTTGTASLDPEKVLLTKHGATLYTIQLGLNFIWMPLFFGLQRPIEATVDVVALTSITGYLIYTWGQVDEVAGYCLAPYLAWLGIATYLSVGYGYLNGWDFSGKDLRKAS
ncbi:hypothetical protein LTR53_000232 [Teratosphaeriaceae sp. CCFEE 6253]|nr:hypothetical protein LTR53_000232 [Teratosphaeriaceae sp. CCFEE 6253]